MQKHDWNPELYLKFNRERLQPSMDLVSRIEIQNPDTIIDLGCGPGNSTQVLCQRWPSAKITGIDYSPAKIQKASTDYPHQQWVLADVSNYPLPENTDIVFSNATLQWIPDHESLLTKICHSLKPKGVLALQIPLFFDMPISHCIEKVARLPQFQLSAKNIKGQFTIHDASFYYRVLSPLSIHIDLWITDYVHIMESHQALLEMIRPTGMKPWLEQMEDDKQKQAFEQYVLAEIQHEYASHCDGKVLFPFKRLFIVAQKK